MLYRRSASELIWNIPLSALCLINQERVDIRKLWSLPARAVEWMAKNSVAVL